MYNNDVDYIKRKLKEVEEMLIRHNEPVKNLYRHLSYNDKAVYEALKDKKLI